MDLKLTVDDSGDLVPAPASKVELIERVRERFLELSNARVVTSNELLVQDAIERLLQRSGIDYVREHLLNARDRIDFLVGDIGIEVKVQGSTASVERQLARYAEHECIAHLILVTSKVRHTQVPPSIGGKPVTTFALWGAIL